MRIQILLVLTILLLGSDVFGQTGQPKLDVQPKFFEFGKAEEGTIVEAKFHLTNVGDAPLDIQRVVPACGCTVAAFEKKSFAPGESYDLTVKFDTRGFFGPKIKSLRL